MRFSSPRWKFLKNLALLLFSVTVIGAAMSLVAGSYAVLSNVYFLAAILLWIIAVVPMFSEAGSTARLAAKTRQAGEKPAELVKAHEAAAAAGARITYFFGLGGLICFALAIAALAF